MIASKCIVGGATARFRFTIKEESRHRTFGNARMIGLGYRPTYRAGACCPACGGSQWHVGRTTAECAICSTALPIAGGAA